jgi:hypothetical protein
MGHWPIESSNLSLSTSEDSNRLSPGGLGSSPWLYIQSEALQGVHGLIDIGSRRVPTFPTAEAKARHRISVTQRLPAVTVGSWLVPCRRRAGDCTGPRAVTSTISTRIVRRSLPRPSITGSLKRGLLVGILKNAGIPRKEFLELL